MPKLTYRVSEIRNSPDWHRIMSEGRLSGDGKFVTIGQDDPAPPSVPHGPQAQPKPAAVPEIKPVPFERWPVWAKTIAASRVEGDGGVGDTAERLFGAFGGELFKAGFKKLTGIDCGCKRRKELWNQQYPYAELPLTS